MVVTLVTLGIVSITAAIIGGGLKAFGIEIPLLKSWIRQLLLAGFGVVLVIAGITLAIINNWSVLPAQNQAQSNSGAPLPLGGNPVEEDPPGGAVPTPRPNDPVIPTQTYPTLDLSNTGLSQLEAETLAYNVWSQAIEAEILAYSTNQPSVVDYIMIDNARQAVYDEVFSINQQGLYYVPAFNYLTSYINAVRVVSDTIIEMDSCEYWSGTYYNLNTFLIASYVDELLLPQTQTITILGQSAFLSNVTFFEQPAFCI